MSKGPFVARIDKVDRAKDVNLQVTRLCDERKSELNMPPLADTSSLKTKDIIVYYLADDGHTAEKGKKTARKERPVLVYLGDIHGCPLKDKSLIWLEKGKDGIKQQKLPKIVEYLLEVSEFYASRRELVEKSLNILRLTQDEETLDALFSMPPLLLYQLLGNKVHWFSSKYQMCAKEELKQIVSDAFIPVQIADAVVALALTGVDLENPCKHDIWRLMALARLHGESQEKIDNFVAACK